MLKAKLVVVGGDAKAGEFNLTLPTVIGRGKEAGLTIPHALVSRAHTEISERDGRLMVKDLGSLNGTFVNNTKIEGEQVLEPRQLLTLGNVTFRAVYEVGGGESDLAAGATLNDRNIAATLVSPKADSPDRETLASGLAESESFETPGEGSVLGDVADTGSALSEIDSFEPDDSDSFGRLSEINSSVFSVQTRGPVKTHPAVDISVSPVAAEQVRPNQEPKSGDQVLDSKTDEPDSGEPLGIDTGQKQSASVSSIDGLPTEQEPQVSFVGRIGEPIEVEDVVDAVKINLGEDKKIPLVDESRLGSFLKRLPK